MPLGTGGNTAKYTSFTCLLCDISYYIKKDKIIFELVEYNKTPNNFVMIYNKFNEQERQTELEIYVKINSIYINFLLLKLSWAIRNIIKKKFLFRFVKK